MGNMARNLLTIAISTLIAACGGSASTASGPAPAAAATIGGTVTGLPSGISVLLVNNGSETINVDTNGGFAFAKKVAAEGAFNVSLYVKPTYADCEIQNGSGTVNQKADAITNVAVVCQHAPAGILFYNVGITVSGLADGKSVTFLNNGTDQLTMNSNGLNIFPKQYLLQSQPGGVYNVSVMTNPAGQTCILTNSSGTNGAAPIPFANFINVTATCK